MIELLEQQNYEQLAFFVSVRVGIILICWLFVVLSNIVDFWSGTSTAKAIGEPLMSHGFRKTITKIGDYVRVLVFALMFDVLGCLLSFYKVPFASILCAIATMFIEGKSVIENSQRKRAHAGEIPKTIINLIKTASHSQKQSLFTLLAKLLTDENQCDYNPQKDSQKE